MSDRSLLCVLFCEGEGRRENPVPLANALAELDQ